ncbi:hypothetical protein P9B03_06710 [Metasolibacillus meyeri]|uniref:Uncharacterized protein n=1 Tax=Metasolibacillus meyeri TaxID=1071052 RepID=A0AAW9NL97_9BACL|nr:hypothetical protein [Metasolibacillus meyeri]MEC1178170.1 hypothetical protein [Metasolibacillus meyeri]
MMKPFAFALFTATLFFVGFWISFKQYPEKFLMMTSIVIFLHLAGLLLIQFSGNTAQMAYLTLFVAIIFTPCFMTWVELLELKKKMTNADLLRATITLPTAYILLFVTVILSYNHYFAKQAQD